MDSGVDSGVDSGLDSGWIQGCIQGGFRDPPSPRLFWDPVSQSWSTGGVLGRASHLEAPVLPSLAPKTVGQARDVRARLPPRSRCFPNSLKSESSILISADFPLCPPVFPPSPLFREGAFPRKRRSRCHSRGSRSPAPCVDQKRRDPNIPAGVFAGKTGNFSVSLSPAVSPHRDR